MAQNLKRIAKKVVRVVVPPQDRARGPKDEPPVLGHRPGIDKLDYGQSPERCAEHEAEHTTLVKGRPYRIFFLCGHPRSGTHWMDNVLNRHRRVVIDGEYRFESLRRAIDDMTGHHWHAAHREPMRSEAERCFRDTVRRVIGASSAHKPDAAWLGDRTPRSLDVYLPGAPHFLIIRDPRDILVSWAHQEIKNAAFNYTAGGFDEHYHADREAFLQNPNYFNERPERLLSCRRFVLRLAGRWRHHLRNDMASLKALDEGRAIGRAHVIRYEKIHTDPEGERQRMYAFLGLDASEAEPLSDETRSRPGLKQENPHNIYRKGQVGDWQRFFTPAVRGWFRQQAGDTLIELGYERDHNW